MGGSNLDLTGPATVPQAVLTDAEKRAERSDGNEPIEKFIEDYVRVGLDLDQGSLQLDVDFDSPVPDG